MKSVLDLDWEEYYSIIQNKRGGKDFQERLDLLKTARRMFEGHNKFEDIGALDREKIAGIGIKDDGEINWYHFDWMNNTKHYKPIIRERFQAISTALENIPLTGIVKKLGFDKYKSDFKKPFPGMGYGLATSTRLLAMKRPDVFVCYTSNNKEDFKKDFKFSHSREFELWFYWNGIIEKVQQTKWWNSPKPIEDREKEVWQCRTAFIDSIYYEKAVRKKRKKSIKL